MFRRENYQICGYLSLIQHKSPETLHRDHLFYWSWQRNYSTPLKYWCQIKEWPHMGQISLTKPSAHMLSWSKSLLFIIWVKKSSQYLKWHRCDVCLSKLSNSQVFYRLHVHYAIWGHNPHFHVLKLGVTSLPSLKTAISAKIAARFPKPSRPTHGGK